MNRKQSQNQRVMDIASPLGTLRLIADGGVIIGIRLPNDLARDPRPDAAARDDSPSSTVLRVASRQLGEYFDGRRQTFDLPLDLQGTAFQRAAWAALCDIPFGETRSYGAQAHSIARPTASRAVGGANARNPIAIVVPCHRVIGSDGRLTGYGGGEPAKRWLLEHEARVLAAGRGAAAPGPRAARDHARL